jgi:hypothetical protein
MNRATQAFPGRTRPRTATPLRVGLAVALLLAVAFALSGRSQSGNGSNSGSGTGSGNSPMRATHTDYGMTASPFDDMDPTMLEKHLAALNVERQKEMVSDTNKLLKLARELNEEVAASRATEFTPDQMKKIAEIEKLAKSVRERMTSAVGPQQPTPYVPGPGVMGPNGRY